MDPGLLKKLALHYIAPHVVMPPTSVFISPTLKCSSKCAHCGVWKTEARLSPLSAGEWDGITGDPFLTGVKTLWFSGGEPTLRPDLPRMANSIAGNIPTIENITLATNGLHPFRFQEYVESTAEQFARQGVYSWTHFSLDGPPDAHDRMRGIEGAFNSLERCVRLLRRFREKGAQVGWGFNCVITDINAPYLEETVATARKLGGNISFNLAMAEGGFYRGYGGGQLGPESINLTVSFLKNMLARSDPYYHHHYETLLDILEGRNRRRRCETLEATLYMDPDGSIYPCPAVYDEFRVRPIRGGLRSAWEELMRYRGYIRRRYCPTCALGCSFGEGVTISEFIQLARKGEK